eukprot:991854-Pelagomonas_calceolata.AAC.1
MQGASKKHLIWGLNYSPLLHFTAFHRCQSGWYATALTREIAAVLQEANGGKGWVGMSECQVPTTNLCTIGNNGCSSKGKRGNKGEQ